MQWKKMLIIDFEATCFRDEDADKPKGWVAAKDQEITEIGAVIYNLPAKEIEASKGFLVRPDGPMGQFCEELTTLTFDRVKDKPNLEVTLKDDLKVWCKANKFDLSQQPWGSWGDYDRVQLYRECARKGIKYPFGRAHYNIKGLFSMLTGRSKGFGVGTALDILGMKFEGRPHVGVDDAQNIARILRNVMR
jgi:inhibitor of KinA sporulation pathway (predicted exonuclease)